MGASNFQALIRDFKIRIDSLVGFNRMKKTLYMMMPPVLCFLAPNMVHEICRKKPYLIPKGIHTDPDFCEEWFNTTIKTFAENPQIRDLYIGS